MTHEVIINSKVYELRYITDLIYDMLDSEGLRPTVDNIILKYELLHSSSYLRDIDKEMEGIVDMAHEVLWGTAVDDAKDVWCFSTPNESGILDDLADNMHFTIIREESEDGTTLMIIEDLLKRQWYIEIAYIDQPGFLDGLNLVERVLK